MIRFWRAAPSLVAALALSGCATGLSLPKVAVPQLAWPVRSAPPIAAKPASGQWPQATSDIAADPEVRFGSLSNGMRYAIRRQSIPAGQAALRLRINAGSLMETDSQQGVAHFLEHMAFNGSTAVPEGEMVRILERLGLAFGADTNASTDFDETVYKLDLPNTAPETVDQSLMLLRETATNLTLDAGAIDRERGVVVSEERARDNPAYRVYKERLTFLLKGQLPPKRFPIGQTATLQAAQRETFVDFYNRYYRPDRTVIVAVGDFDPAEMESRIKAKFGDWSPGTLPSPDPVQGKVQPRKAEAKLVVEKGAPLSIQMVWLRSPDIRADSTAKRQAELVQQLAFAVVNRRLSALSRSAQPPFLGAGVFETNEYDAAEMTMVTVNADASRWSEALSAVEQAQRQAVQYGVRQDELDREIAELRTNLETDVAGAATRTPSQLAGEILGSLAEQDVVTSPAQDLALFDATVKGLKASAVSETLKASFKGQGPLVFMTAPKSIPGGEAALLGVLETSRKVAVAAPEAPRQMVWPYASFGTPGIVAETRDITDLDTVFVRFENGVRLTIKPTHFQDDEVMVRVNVGHGRIDLPRDRQNVAWAQGAYIEGGLKQIAAEDMERVLAANYYGASFGIGDDAFILSGNTRPGDLDVQMQILAAYLTEPGWRPEAFERLKTSGKTVHDQYEATDNGVLQRDLGGLLHGGDARWVFPSKQEIANARLEAFQNDVAPALAAGAIEVVVVGDITVDKAIEAVAATLGALPPRPSPPPPQPEQLTVRFPKPTPVPVSLHHKGRADQATGFVAWPTTDFYANPQRARDVAVMGEVLDLRLTAELREKQGATYSPSVNYSHSMVWPGWGYVSASVEIPPDKLSAFFRDVSAIATDLKTNPVTPDELARAKQPRLERIAKSRETNGYWLGELSGAQAEPRRLDAIRAILPGTERVTAEDIQAAAKAVLSDDTIWKLSVTPATK